MPLTSWSNAIKLRACRYLLHRYLGQFLQHKLSLEQLNIQIAANSKACISNLDLDVAALNRVLEEVKLPFEVIDGFIGSVSLVVPLSTLFTNSTELEIANLEVTLRPKASKQNGADEFALDAMVESMTLSTRELAEKCITKEDQVDDDENDNELHANDAFSAQFAASSSSGFAGVEKFAQAVDVVLCRTKVSFVDTVFRIELVSSDGGAAAAGCGGVAVEIRIKRIDYRDESLASTDNDQTAKTVLGDTLRKQFTLEGVEIFHDRFTDKCLVTSSSAGLQRSQFRGMQSSSVAPDVFHSTIEMSASESAENGEGSLLNPTVSATNLPVSTMTTSYSRLASGLGSRLTKVISVGQKCHVHLTIQNSTASSSSVQPQRSGSASVAARMRLQLIVDISSVTAVFWPNQLHTLETMLDAFLGHGTSAKLSRKLNNNDKNIKAQFNDNNVNNTGQKPLTDVDYNRIEAELRRQFNQRHQDLVTVPAATSSPHAGNRLSTQNAWAGSDDKTLENVAFTSVESGRYYSMDLADVIVNESKEPTKSVNNGAVVVAPQAGARTDFRMKINSLIALLHECDEWIDGKIWSALDLKVQDENAAKFFSAVCDTTVNGGLDLHSNISSSADSRRTKIASVCNSNHLLLMCSPLIFELTSDKRPSLPPTAAVVTRSEQQRQFDLVVFASANNMHLWEHIYSDKKGGSAQSHIQSDDDAVTGLGNLHTFPVCSTLLSFPRRQYNHASDELSDSEPCVVLQLRAHANDIATSPTIHINVKLAPFECDVDLSIIDRLYFLLHGGKRQMVQPTEVLSAEISPQLHRPERMQHASNGTSSARGGHADSPQVMFQLTTSSVKICLKIPVYDGRAPLEKLLDYGRLKSVHLHGEMLVLELEQFSFTNNPSRISETSFSITCDSGRLLFKPGVYSEPIPLAWIACCENNNSKRAANVSGSESKTQACELTFTLTDPANNVLLPVANRSDAASHKINNNNSSSRNTIDKKTTTTRAKVVRTASASDDDDDDDDGDDVDADDIEFSSATPYTFLHGNRYTNNSSSSKRQPTLFASSRRVVEGDDKGFMCISPGDRHTVDDFIEKATKMAKIRIGLCLPQIYLALPEKALIEVFYNRVFNDLFMWEPLSTILTRFGLTLESALLGSGGDRTGPKHVHGGEESGEKNGMTNSSYEYREFKRRGSSNSEWLNGDELSSQSDNEDGVLLKPPPPRNSMYYSVHAGDLASSLNDAATTKSKRLLPIDRNAEFINDVAVRVRIIKGAVVIRTPSFGDDAAADDKNSGKMHGEIWAQVNEANVFVVTGYHGQPELQYIYTSVADGSIFSKPCVLESLSQYFHTMTTFSDASSSSSSWSIAPPSIVPAAYLNPVLSPSNQTECADKMKACAAAKPEMLRVAVEIRFDSFRNVKDIKVALGVAHASLEHRFSRSAVGGVDWLEQLTKFFDIEEYPIEGLSWPTTVTELHVDAVDSCVLYRPLFLPLTAVIFAGHLNVASTIMGEAVSTLLRLVVQDVWVLLRDINKGNNKRNNAVIDLANDFVCVVEVPYFELETRVSKAAIKNNDNAVLDVNDDDGAELPTFSIRKRIMKSPMFDLKVSNSAVHVRACPDSFQALCDLLVYCANEGDFAVSEVRDTINSAQKGLESSSDLIPYNNAATTTNFAEPEMVRSAGTNAPVSVLDTDAAAAADAAGVGIDVQMSDAMQEDYRQHSTTTSSHAAPVTTSLFRNYNNNAEISSNRQSSALRQQQQQVSRLMSQSVVYADEGKIAALDDAARRKVPLPVHQITRARDASSDLLSQSVHISSSSSSSRRGNNSTTSSSRPGGARSSRGGGGRHNHRHPYMHEHDDDIDEDFRRSAVTLGDEDFCLIDQDLGAGILPKADQIAIKRFVDGGNNKPHGAPSPSAIQTIKVIDNHFAVPSATIVDQLKAPSDYPCPEDRVTIQDMNVMFCIYGGFDFDDASATSSSKSAVRDALPNNNKDSDASQTSLTRGGEVGSRIPRWLRRGGAGRDHSKLIEIRATKIRFQHDRYPYTNENAKASKHAARQVLLVKNIEIHDRLALSSINKFLYQHSTSSLPRQSHTNMLEIRALHERPNPGLSAQQECSLKVSLKPLRLNVDQQTLLFLRDWFASIGSKSQVPTRPPKEAAVVAAADTVRLRSASSSANLPSIAATVGMRRAADETTVKAGNMLSPLENRGGGSPSVSNSNNGFSSEKFAASSPAMPPRLIRRPSTDSGRSIASAASSSSSRQVTNGVAGVERARSPRFLIDLNDAADDTAAVNENDEKFNTDAPYNKDTTVGSAELDSSEAAAAANLQPIPGVRAPVIPEASSSTSLVATANDPATNSAAGGGPSDLSQIYFRSFTFAPEVPIRLDYHGRFQDLGGGIVGLLTGLAQFNFSQITLKRINHRQGVMGANKLAAVVAREWIDDIRFNQLTSILQGIGPAHSFVQVLQGFRDLFWMPFEQYRRDGRIITGVQRGANAFTTSTLMAMLELTRGFVGIVQRAAECCFDIMSPPGGAGAEPHTHVVHLDGFSNTHNDSNRGVLSTRTAHAAVHQQLQQQHNRMPPSDFREGVVNAYEVLRGGMADYVAGAASDVAAEGTIVGAAGATLRLPVHTVALISAAASNMLGGLRNQLQPEARKDDIEKWKFSPQDSSQRNATEAGGSNRVPQQPITTVSKKKQQLTAMDLLYSDDDDDDDVKH